MRHGEIGGARIPRGLLKQRLMDLTNLLGVVLRAMESLHLNGLGQGGWVREDKDQKEPPSSVQPQLKNNRTGSLINWSRTFYQEKELG